MTDTSTNTTVADALRAEQRRRQLNQRQAAELCGVDQNVYGRWVSDRGHLPSIQNIVGVAAFLSISEADVLAMFPSTYRARSARGAAAGEVEELRAQVRKVVDMLVELRAELQADNERRDAEMASMAELVRTQLHGSTLVK